MFGFKRGLAKVRSMEDRSRSNRVNISLNEGAMSGLSVMMFQMLVGGVQHSLNWLASKMLDILIPTDELICF